jgi:Rieske Fe-S protein
VAGVTGPLLVSCHSGRQAITTTSPAAGAPLQAVVDVSPLVADGDWLLAPWTGPDGAPVLIVRQAPSQYLALSLQCTHMGCPVNTPVQGVLTCPCHGSQFGLGGDVRHGPAQYPLGRYGTTFDSRTKTVSVSLG